MITPTLTIGSARSEVHSVHKSVCTTTLRWAILQPSEGVHTIHNMHAHQHQQVSVLLTTSPTQVGPVSQHTTSTTTTVNNNSNTTAHSQLHCLGQAACVTAAAQPKSCCTATWLHGPTRGWLEPVGWHYHNQASMHCTTNKTCHEVEPTPVKSAAAADTKLPGWHGQVLLVHSPATCRATTTHC